jgi:hypothetical protein
VLLLIGVALGCRLDVRGFESRQELGIHLFTTVSKMAVGPTQPPIQWVPGALSLGVKRPGREADRSRPSSAEINNAWRYTSAPQYAFLGLKRPGREADHYFHLVPRSKCVEPYLHSPNTP